MSNVSDKSTDSILSRATIDAGNHDVERDKVHFDATTSADTRRAAAKATNWETFTEFATDALGKGASMLADHAAESLSAKVTSGLLRGALGGGVVIAGTAVGLHELYRNKEKAACEGDAQRTAAASDAGVVALAKVLPFDDAFRNAVVQVHRGSDTASAAVETQLRKGEHADEVAAMKVRADQGLVDAAKDAKTAARELVPTQNELARARAYGDTVLIGHLMHRMGLVQKDFEAKTHARDDAARGLGVQCAFFHAVRAEMGKEKPEVLDQLVETAKAKTAGLEPAEYRARG